jgi:hypothetical protein
MDQKYQMLALEKPDDAAWEMIGGGITAFNQPTPEAMQPRRSVSSSGMNPGKLSAA